MNRAAPPATTDWSTSRNRRRWLVLISALAVGLLLQLLPALILDRRDRILPRFVFWIVEMPTLVVALSLAYDWSQKRNVRPRDSVLVSFLLAVVIGGASAVVAHHLVLHFWGSEALPGPPGKPVALLAMIVFGIMAGLFTAGLWAFSFVYPFALEDSHLRALEAEKFKLEAESLRAESELQSLRARLEPHFLLNTLNAIAGLVTQEPKEARRLLATLGELLSDTLREGEIQTLAREMIWLRGYASILEARFRGALDFEWHVDESVQALEVPRLFLQPLVENAVTHGALRRRGGGGLVQIDVARSEDRLVCRIRDNGPGFDESAIREGAIGVSVVRQRLRLWSVDARLDFTSSDAGTTATVILPLPEGA